MVKSYYFVRKERKKKFRDNKGNKMSEDDVKNNNKLKDYGNENEGKEI